MESWKLLNIDLNIKKKKGNANLKRHYMRQKELMIEKF